MINSQREIIETADGSHTLYLPHIDEHYHSTLGAETESQHVFVQNGLAKRLQSAHTNPLKLLEVGFGTGLNALLTLRYLQEQAPDTTLIYRTYELYPLEEKVIDQFYHKLPHPLHHLALTLHQAPWEKEVVITEQFTLHKIHTDLTQTHLLGDNDVIYMDAFAPDKTPELWSTTFLQHLYDATALNGILSTYSAKGSVRRSLIASGYKVIRTPGPIGGKREILVAHKT